MIVEPEEVRLTLGVASGGEDAAMLERVHRRVEQMVKDFVYYDVEQTTQIEHLPTSDLTAGLYDPLVGYGVAGADVYGSEILHLRHLPVRSITAVAYDSSARFAGAETTYDTSAYRLELSSPGLSTSGRLYNAGGWPTEPGTVRVTYVGGWTADELGGVASVFATAVLQATAMNFNQFVANRAASHTAGTGAVNAETLDGETIQYARAGINHGFVLTLPESVQRMLMPHVNILRRNFS
jgi:hypothetical protein